MKKISFLSIILLLVISSCSDKIEETYIVNEPVYMSYTDLRKSVNVTKEQPIVQPGKIYFKDNLIFVNEYLKGIHVLDNTDPSNPQVIKFIEVPGNVDLAIKGSMLYVDSYIDLVVLDITNLDNITEVNRIENAFPYMMPIVQQGVVEAIDQAEGVVVGWETKSVTREVKNSNINFRYYSDFATSDVAISSNGANGSESGSGVGTGGSMARFTIYQDYLYAVSDYQLRLVNISEPNNPYIEKEEYIGWQIETIFPYDEKLFIGSQSGLFIYSIEDPSNPNYISEYRHVTACDPVVVEGDYAYVTLRSGNLCGAGESQLDVIDLSNITEPELVKAYEMVEPYGLGIDNNVLFVCDGYAGLKIYDASDVNDIENNQLAYYPNVNAFDVIPLGNVLLMIGVDGLYQYNYQNLDSIYELSFIPIYNQ